MMKLSVYGLDCAACTFRTKQNCPGCQAMAGKPFWGECDLYRCCTQKSREHCGQCDRFPCDTLNAWAAQEPDNRVDNLRRLNEASPS